MNETHGARPAILLLGSGHLANHNRDVFNTQFDDMLAPKRQAEIRLCVDKLKLFRPTKVALEVLPEHADHLNGEYRRFRSGAFALTAWEGHQIGFRLATELGHEAVYAIDWNEPIGDMGAIFDFAREHQPELYEELVPRGQQALDEAQASVATTSVLEMLRLMNSPESLRESHRPYLTMSRVGAGKEYVGVDWVKGWYQRNLIIFVNLTRIVTGPEDRVLVVYGAGHIPLLTQFVRDSGLYDIETLVAYLGEAGG